MLSLLTAHECTSRPQVQQGLAKILRFNVKTFQKVACLFLVTFVLAYPIANFNNESNKWD